MINSTDFTFDAGSEQLAGKSITANHSLKKGGILFLHGAGKATKERAEPIALRLAEDFNISSFLFDFSGHGNSTGTLERSSLNKRTNEARVALEISRFRENVTICAFSMGGHIALELLELPEVCNVILFYPAVYSDKVVNIPFGDPGFSKAIRVEGGWKSSKTFNNLEELKGGILIFIGEKDEVIPSELPNYILSNATKAKNKEIQVIKDGTHMLLPYIFKDEGLYNDILRKIDACFRTNC